MANLDELFRKIGSRPAGPVSWLIVGLGNPGKEYEGTRHNAGFCALDALAEDADCDVSRAKWSALVGECTIGDARVLLMKPQTYMNLSGTAVKAAAEFYKIPPEHVLVLCDDVSFDPGTLRLRRKGSHGGHNGLRNITAELSSEDFPRFKFGVGKKPTPEYDLADWVLGKLPKEDREKLAAAARSAVSAIRLWLAGREEEAMNLYSK